MVHKESTKVNDSEERPATLIDDNKSEKNSVNKQFSIEKNCKCLTDEESKDILKNEYDRKNGKIFKNRDSLITMLFQNQNFKTILNLCLISLSYVFISSLLEYTMDEDKPHNEAIDVFVRLIKIFPYYLYILAKITITSLLFYPVLYIFFYFRTLLNNMFYILWVLTFGLGFILFTHYSYKEISGAERNVVFTFMLAIEQVRLVMKIWAFLHENLKKIKSKNESDDDLICPSFSHFLYFLYIPTAVYRDEYPKRSTRDMKVALKYFLQSVGCFIGVIFIYYNYVYSEFKDFGLKKITSNKFQIMCLKLAIPSSIIQILIFYSFLHCWQNLFAELLKFGDRLFYTDWWNSNSYSDYYKKWNIVVQDWLKTYLFDEIRCRFPKKIANNISSIFVIMISAIIHEYVAYLVVGSFCPAFLIQFGIFGAAIKFLKPKNSDRATLSSWNILLLSALMHGNSIFMAIYSAEYFANINCPHPQNTSFLNRLVPRFITANCY